MDTRLDSKGPFFFLLLTLLIGAQGLASEPTPKPSESVKGEIIVVTSAGSPSRLDRFSPEEREKKAELDTPLTVKVLGRGRSVERLEEIRDRIVDVRVTNPNLYPVFFRGRQFRDNQTISAIWKVPDGQGWKLQGWDWCGTRVSDREIPAGGSINLMLTLLPGLEAQQILCRFYRVDQPSTQSDCLLYETRDGPKPTSGTEP